MLANSYSRLALPVLLRHRTVLIVLAIVAAFAELSLAYQLPQPRSIRSTTRSRTTGTVVGASANSIPHQSTRSIIQSSANDEVALGEYAEEESAVVLDEPSSLLAADCDSCSSAYDFLASRRSRNCNNYLMDWSRTDLWLGTTAFTNPGSVFYNGSTAVGQTEGSFGFQEGFNVGGQLPGLLAGQIGSQLGMRFVQANLDGSTLSNSSRNQMFLTAGLFRRVDYGVQGGVVFDYMHEHWIDNADLWQVRGELSFLFSPAHELGFRFTDNGKLHNEQAVIPATSASTSISLRAADTYQLFARYRFGACHASSAQFQLGTTDQGGVLLAGGLQQPISGQLGLDTSILYLTPKPSQPQPHTAAAWSIGVSLVWTPGRKFGTQLDYYRPLFDVAGNNSFITVRP